MEYAEKVVVFFITAIMSPVVVSSMVGHTPRETAVNVASSVILSETPIGAMNSVAGYSFGFICHAKTTEAAFKALRESDSGALEEAARLNQKCFSLGRSISGI